MRKKINVQAEFVPVRWWQIIDFIRLYFETVRGRDPWADKVLARPWSPSSVLEYLYLVDNYFHMQVFFIQAAGQRVGMITLRNKPAFIYLDGLGLLPEFQHGTLGQQGVQFIRDLCLQTNHTIALGTTAVRNRHFHLLMGAWGGRVFGLSTTTLPLKKLCLPEAAAALTCRQVNRKEAEAAWLRWRLYEVKQTGGEAAAAVAPHLLEKLPSGQYAILLRNTEEIGFVFTCKDKEDICLGLFPAQDYWSNEQTLQLLAASLSCLMSPRPSRLTVTQTHANALTISETFDFERNKGNERHIIFFQRA
jgi:hypothetical protein